VGKYIVGEGRQLNGGKMTEGNLVSKRTTRIFVEDHHNIVESCSASQMTNELQRCSRSQEKEKEGRWSSTSSVIHMETPVDIGAEFAGIGMVPYGVEDLGKEGMAHNFVIPLGFMSNILHSFQEAPDTQGRG
jgi:hypothetical protein